VSIMGGTGPLDPIVCATMLPGPLLHWRSVVDWGVLTIVVYWFLNWAIQTRVLRLFVGIGALIIAGGLAGRMELVITAWILHIAAIASVVLLVIVFHSEIRHALIHLDPLNRLVRSGSSGTTSDWLAIGEAAFSLAATHRGALIVLSGKQSLKNLLTGGVPLDGAISKEILEAIFRKVSPVHDGAVVIDGDRISRVGAFLPLTNREELPRQYGTRHRAAVGLAEQTDAAVIVVSEERGEVSIVQRVTITAIRDVAELVQRINGVRLGAASPTCGSRIRAHLLGNWKPKLSAVAISLLIWGLVFMTGSSIRTFTAPIELENVPAGLEVSEPLSNVIVVQLRAATRLFATLDEKQLVVRLDLKGLNEGFQNIPVDTGSLNLPPGVFLDRASPPTVGVNLVRH